MTLIPPKHEWAHPPKHREVQNISSLMEDSIGPMLLELDSPARKPESLRADGRQQVKPYKSIFCKKLWPKRFVSAKTKRISANFMSTN